MYFAMMSMDVVFSYEIKIYILKRGAEILKEIGPVRRGAEGPLAKLHLAYSLYSRLWNVYPLSTQD